MSMSGIDITVVYTGMACFRFMSIWYWSCRRLLVLWEGQQRLWWAHLCTAGSVAIECMQPLCSPGALQAFLCFWFWEWSFHHWRTVHQRSLWGVSVVSQHTAPRAGILCLTLWGGSPDCSLSICEWSKSILHFYPLLILMILWDTAPFLSRPLQLEKIMHDSWVGHGTVNVQEVGEDVSWCGRRPFSIAVECWTFDGCHDCLSLLQKK